MRATAHRKQDKSGALAREPDGVHAVKCQRCWASYKTSKNTNSSRNIDQSSANNRKRGTLFRPEPNEYDICDNTNHQTNSESRAKCALRSAQANHRWVADDKNHQTNPNKSQQNVQQGLNFNSHSVMMPDDQKLLAAA